MIELKNINFAYGVAAEADIARHVEDGESLRHDNEVKPNAKDEIHNPCAGRVVDINMHIKKGECVLLCGQSGCGKTTITRILNGLCPSFYDGEMSGEYLIDGEDTQEMSLNDIGLLTGNVFQDPRSQFFCSNTSDELVFAMENRDYSIEKMQERLEELVDIFPILERLLDKKIFDLSSGEKQIIAIASVCAAKPKVLIMDEPTANLDTKTTVLLGDMLSALKAEGTSIVIAEHRLHFAQGLFDRAILMEDGKITCEFTREEALALSHEELEHYGLRLFETPKLPQSRSIDKKWEDYCGIDMVKVDMRYGDKYPLDSVNFHSPYGKVLAIVGNNGAGKSSLCRALTGVSRVERGDIKYNGLKMLTKRSKLRRAFLVAQDADYQLHSHTVLDEFWAGKKRDYISDKEIDIAKKAIESFGLKGFEERHPQSLSGGQKQRLLLAIASISDRELIVFDEPTSGLDGFNMRRTAKRIRELSKKGKNVVLITHDIELISRAADSVAFMIEGRVTGRLMLERGE